VGQYTERLSAVRKVLPACLYAAVVLTVLVAAMPQPGWAQQPAGDQPRALGPAIPVTSQPQPPAAAASSANGADADTTPLPSNMEVFPGTGTFVKPPQTNAPARGTHAGDVTLDFTDADIQDVLRAILGDMLKVPYVVDPAVTGKVTLKTGTPIGIDAVLPALEAALRANGAAIVQGNGIYSIVPLADAQKRGAGISVGGASDPGYGTEIVSLNFITASEMQKILEPLVPPGASLRIDERRNLLFLSGAEPERAAMRDTIALFDVNYLRGMSFAMIRPQHVDAGTLAGELEKIFNETSSPIAGLVRMIPISRINSLLVVSSRPTYLTEIGRWVTRLDVVPTTPGRQLYYYRLQNVRAGDIAQTLAKLYGGTGAAPPPSRTAARAASPDMPSPVTTGAGSPAIMPAISADASAPSTGSISVGGNDDGPQIVTDEGNNALIIRADAADYEAIMKIVREMDVAPDQVMIETSIIEVTLNDQLKYGVEWYFKNGSQTFAQAATGTPATNFPGFGYTLTMPNVQVALSALGTLTNVTVLSSPKLLTLDNKPATIEVGDEVPIVTQTSVSTTAPNAPLISTVDQRDTGVILSVTPRIGNSGVVFLDVSQEVSDVIPTTTSGIDSPTIQQRRLKSTVAIADGTTVALGGFIRRSDSGGNSGLPYLKDLPVIGGLFGAQNNTRDRTELLIFLTPHVIRSTPAALAVTDDLKKSLDDLRAAVEHFDANRNDIPRRLWR
jgi:general secretion pathway protein D